MTFYKYITNYGVKRKKFVLIIIYLFLSIVAFENFSKALDCDLIYLRTNKNQYFSDESIEIEASWSFDYIEMEKPFFQIKIFNDLDELVWNSSRFEEKGVFEENWNVKIENLNLNFGNYSNIISIKAYVFNELNGGDMISYFLDTLYVTILKRSICCELLNFTDKLILGENLSLIARFNSEGTNVSLSEKEILVYVISNKLKVYEGNFTSNYEGLISFKLSSLNDMRVGINSLVFNITNGFIYNQTIFSYQILVEKTPVYIDILKYEKSLGLNENLKLELFFYFLNESIIPLKNQTIEILIYDNQSINYRIFSLTNEFGMLKINISPPYYDLNSVNQKFYINLAYNGSWLLKGKSLVLEFEILTIKLPDNNFLLSLLITIIGCLVIILVAINFIYQNRKKKPKFKKVNEICFKF